MLFYLDPGVPGGILKGFTLGVVLIPIIVIAIIVVAVVLIIKKSRK